MGKEDRRHLRTRVRSKVRMAHNELGELVVYSGDISDSGVFVELVSQEKPAVDDIVSLQIVDLPVEAPIIKARVVRITKHGLGLEFVDENTEID
ncbi:PilZ domain-containing protein [Pleionea sediminis]|uniref:PilZ domain-containing protein n=1 Tax=Pleionea sediminis TaxID=2569479 RepID=UPI001184F04A|nr:PilZ domain-containing protein [Pleionea sediminis]